MTPEKYTFIQSFFNYIQAEEYVLLKWLGNDLATLPEGSDLDILVRPALIKKIDIFINNTASILKIDKVKKAGVCHYYLYFEQGGFLQIDLLVKFVRKNLIYLSKEAVFQNSIIVNGIKTCTKTTILEHVLLFNYLNGSGLPKKYENYYSKLPLNLQELLINKFNHQYNTEFKGIKDTTIFNPTNRLQIIKYLNTQQENTFLKKVVNGTKYLMFIGHSIKENRSQTITFSGVDGAGKSTIINDIRCLLEDKYRKKVVVLRHRPSLLPIISAWKYGKKEAEQRSIARLPRQGKNNNKITSYLRFGYYFLDYLVGQLYIWWKYLLRGYIVLYDRYYFDFMLDGKRSNINISENVPKFLYPFIAKPDLNVFLYADVATILKRKQELSPTVIETLTKQYKALFKEYAQKQKEVYLSIENNNKKDTLRTILNHYLKIA